MKECRTCNICSSPSTFEKSTDVATVHCHVRKFRDDRFTVWRCANCGSLHSKEVANLDAYYADYPFKKQTLDFFTRVAYANRVRLLRKLGVRNDSALIDYGCGNGLYVDYLRGYGFKSVFGFDPYCPRFNDRSVLERNYDVVVSHDVIEHVEDAHDFLQTMIGLSKPGGLVVIGTPNASELNLQDKTGPAVELSQPYHRHIFSEQALIEITVKRGFEPVQIYRRFYFDSLIPAVNIRFMWEYIRRCEGMIDVAVEPFRWRLLLTSPKMIFLAFFGYFWRSPGNILISFRNNSEAASRSPIREAANG